jgi:putative acetyltransferase
MNGAPVLVREELPADIPAIRRIAPFVIVLGHPAFCPRFGFEPCSRRGIRSPWERVPDEAFMIRVLQEAPLQGVTGVARYRPEFDGAV